MQEISLEAISFGRSSSDEQQEELEIGVRCFGNTYITPLAERIRFQEQNCYSFHSLKVQQHVVGYFSLFRFTSVFLDSLLCGTHIERDITIQDVLAFSQHEPFDIYVDVIVVDPQLPRHLQHLYAGLLILYYTDLILHLADQGFCIKHIYAVTTTAAGAKLTRRLGMLPMPDKSQVPGRVAWACDFQQDGYAIYCQHQKDLRRYQQKVSSIQQENRAGIGSICTPGKVEEISHSTHVPSGN